MAKITVLDQNTINQIAAGEVIERPSAVVKELVENSIDAGANAITVEIKEGGAGFIRITDNGTGIEEEDIPLVFLRHSTSKIKTAEDLLHVSSLGFRGEALSSIAAVSQVELVTKTAEAFTGIHYRISGGEEKGLEHIGCPDGTTFIIRNLFYNTPARRKFLKSPVTEAGYISELMERLAVSRPDISFKFINNTQIKLHTSGNGNLKDIIYNVYGRDITSHLLSVGEDIPQVSLTGFIAKPVVSRGNRSYENYFINGRYIKSSIISKAIEEAYKSYSMSHRYPFTALHFQMDSELIDVNVHPAKLEIRFKNSEELYRLIYQALRSVLEGRELIPEVRLTEEKQQAPAVRNIPEPFEIKRRQEAGSAVNTSNPERKELIRTTEIGKLDNIVSNADTLVKETADYKPVPEAMKRETAPSDTEFVPFFKQAPTEEPALSGKPEQLSFLSEEAIIRHSIIGQVFSTYWIVEFGDKMFLIDQHAAHEKVLYEKTMKALREKQYNSQLIDPPVIISLNMREEEAVKKFAGPLSRIGFEIEEFGGKEYALRAVPSDLYGLAQNEILIELIDGLVDEVYNETPEIILEKVASMSCKAAVKGNHRLSRDEAEALIGQLLTLENPYHCPHGRPTIISMSKYEIEKKFKRII